jgi:hypothetical protein
MNLNEAKQAAYSAANRASAKIKVMMQREPPATVEDAAELVNMARALNCAAEELLARLQGVPEAKRGEPEAK